MQVNSVNQLSFGAKTKKGNEYKKTHAGKILFPLVTIGGPALLAGAGIGILSKTSKGDKIQKMKDRLADFGITKKLITAGVIALILIKIGIGFYIDTVKNKKRAEAADRAAESRAVANAGLKIKLL